MEEALKKSLDTAINEFNRNRAAILKLAFKEEGQQGVERLTDQYNTMRNLYFEILKAQLDKNNAGYNEMIISAKEEAENLTTSIKKLNNINDIINSVSSIISFAEKIVSTLCV